MHAQSLSSPAIAACLSPSVQPWAGGAKVGSGLRQHQSQTLSEQTEGSGSSVPLQSKSSSLRPLGARPSTDVNVRDKTQVQFVQALQKAVEEQGKEAESIDVNKVAHNVEVELFKLFGEHTVLPVHLVSRVASAAQLCTAFRTWPQAIQQWW